MRKILVIFLIIAALGVLLLNVEVSTRQGINYKVQDLKMPLYLKLLDFFDRHFNYKQLVKGITKGAKTDAERAMRIFEWTGENIRRPLKAMPVIDDHVWYIIVRGYGEADQASDVFTTLCNYAGIKAFYTLAYAQDHKSLLPLSLVKIGQKWVVFDPYHRVYFQDKNGDLADIAELKRNNWVLQARSEKPNVDYSLYFNDLPSAGEIGLIRANIQSPLNRILFEIKKRARR